MVQYGILSCGRSSVYLGTTERFDNVTTSLTLRTAASPRSGATGYSITYSGFSNGGTTGGYVGTVEKFIDVLNIHTSQASISKRYLPAGFSLYNISDLSWYGFVAGGIDPTAMTGIIERYNDLLNTQTLRTSNITPRTGLAGFSLNGYGFLCCGATAIVAGLGTNERYEDISDSITLRASGASRRELAAYAMSGFGFTSGGWTNSITQRYDNLSDTYLGRAVLPDLVRHLLAGYSINDYGFVSCGWKNTNTVLSPDTIRLDDVANTQMNVNTSAIARAALAGYAIEEVQCPPIQCTFGIMV